MRADVEERVEDQDSRRRARERLLAAVVAVALGVASFVFVARAFLGPSSTSRRTADPVTPPVANGLLAFPAAFPAALPVSTAIYSMNPDGTGISNLTGTYDPSVVVAAYGPRWSPDGTRIAFYGYSAAGVDDYNGGANYDVYAMKPDGTGVTNLTTTPDDIATEFSQGSPTWSPDGTRIAYDGDDGLYVMNADGSNQTRIATGQDSSWSPDGTRIAFEGPGGAIWSVAPDGSALSQLTTGNGDVFPAYSPDGTKIAYCHCHDRTMAIHVMNADGSGQLVVADLQADTMGRPAWSPDGTRLIFEALVSVSPGTDGHPDFNYDIYSVNANGTGLADLTPTTNRTENSPVWAPDGTKIAFEASTTLNGENAGTYDIYFMNPDGTGEQRLTTDQHATGGELTWQAVPTAEESPSPSPEPLVLSPTGPIRPHLAGIIPVTTAEQSAATDVVPGEGAVWVGLWLQHDGEGGSILRIDPATNEVSSTIPLDGAPVAIAAGDGSVWVDVALRDGSGERLERIDPATNDIVASIPIGYGGGGLRGAVAVGEDAVWAWSSLEDGSRVLYRIDPSSSEVVATVPLGSAPHWGDFGDGQVVLGEGSVWVLDWNGDLLRVDPSTDAVVDTISVGGFDMVLGEGILWVDVQPSGTERGVLSTGYVQRVDAATGELLGDAFPVRGGWPTELDGSSSPLAVDEYNLWVDGYSGPYGNITIARMDLDTMEVVDSIRLPLGQSPGIAFDEATQTAWVDGTYTLYRVDLRDPEPILPDPSAEQCPAKHEMGPSPVWSSPEGAAGSTVTVSGWVPHYHEDGSYGPGDILQWWWNADPSDNGWAYLTPGSTREPEAAVPGPILLMGEANPRWACTFEAQLRIPNVPPGTYSVIELESGGGGAALLGDPITFQVTGP